MPKSRKTLIIFKNLPKLHIFLERTSDNIKVFGEYFIFNGLFQYSLFFFGAKSKAIKKNPIVNLLFPDSAVSPKSEKSPLR